MLFCPQFQTSTLTLTLDISRRSQMIKWVYPKATSQRVIGPDLLEMKCWKYDLHGRFGIGRYTSSPPTPSPPFPATSTRSPGGGRRPGRSIWSPQPCWQTSDRSGPAWPSGSRTRTWTPRRSGGGANHKTHTHKEQGQRKQIKCSGSTDMDFLGPIPFFFPHQSMQMCFLSRYCFSSQFTPIGS